MNRGGPMHSFAAVYYDRPTLTELGAHLDDFDDPTLRETGTRDLLEALGAHLAQTLASV
jgi:hypothetical protein